MTAGICANCGEAVAKGRYCDKGCEGEAKRSTLGGRAWAIRTKGVAWKDIAAALGYKSSDVAISAARRHARYTERPWPPR